MPPSDDARLARRDAFVRDGFLRIDNGFTPELAAEVRAILWRDCGCDPEDRATWTRPVVRLGHYTDPPFIGAMSGPVLAATIDALIGAGKWMPLTNVGTFPIRFPSRIDPGDTGWHVDMSLDHEKPDFMDWRVNIGSQGRALLLIALFSDVGEEDAPTRIRVGSHRDIARMLAPAGQAGMTLRALAANGFAETEHRPETLATGPAGTVYVCHPFLVHAAQPHRGLEPRFMAQPALLPRGETNFGGPSDTSAVGEAVRSALADD